MEAARKAAASSKSYEDHLWLGQVLGVVARQTKTDGQSKKAGELTAEAEKAFRRAVELEPKVAMTWVGLIQFLSASGAKEQAQQALQEAAQKIPAKQAPLALAQCCEAMQDVNAAQKKYEAAPAQPPMTRSSYVPWPISTFAPGSPSKPKSNSRTSSSTR